MKKVKAHPRYRLKDGSVVPGVTTITGTMGDGKEGLIRWAIKETSQGNDALAMRDRQAQVGALAHAYISEYLYPSGDPVDTSEYGQGIIDDALRSYQSFEDWAADHTIEIIATEIRAVSEVYSYGGTIDLVAKLDGIPAILDHKTSSQLYTPHIVQLSAYQQLFEEGAGQRLDKAIVLQLRQQGKAIPHEIDNLREYFPIFQNLLKNWRLRKKLGR